MVNQQLKVAPAKIPTVFVDLKTSADRLDSLISEFYGNVMSRRASDCARIINRMENEIAHAKQLTNAQRITP